MNVRRHTKLVHEGQYLAEVEVSLIETEEGWSPSLSLDDAWKLDEVRKLCAAAISSARLG